MLGSARLRLRSAGSPARSILAHAFNAPGFTGSPTVTLPSVPPAGSTIVLIVSYYDAFATPPTAVSGCGATWTKLGTSPTTSPHNSNRGDVWIGTGCSGAGSVITVTVGSGNYCVLSAVVASGGTVSGSSLGTAWTSGANASTGAVTVATGDALVAGICMDWNNGASPVLDTLTESPSGDTFTKYADVAAVGVTNGNVNLLASAVAASGASKQFTALGSNTGFNADWPFFVVLH